MNNDVIFVLLLTNKTIKTLVILWKPDYLEPSMICSGLYTSLISDCSFHSGETILPLGRRVQISLSQCGQVKSIQIYCVLQT